MRTCDVIEGRWLVETDLPASEVRILGALTLQSAAYHFVPGPDLRLDPSSARFVPFIATASGVLVIHYLPTVTAQTLIDALPLPPRTGGCAQELRVASLEFPDSGTSTHQFRITLDLDQQTARFHPEFHATMFNNPCRVTRSFASTQKQAVPNR